MATFEQVEKLKTRANVSFEEARDALNACNGDLLDALIMLERKGKTETPPGGGYYASEPVAMVPQYNESRNKKKQKNNYRYHSHNNDGMKNFKEFMASAGRFVLKLIEIGNRNSLEVWRDGGFLFSVPISVFVLLLLFMFWAILPLMFVSLFFKFRYHIKGNELGKDFVNDAMDGAADAASSAADSIRNSYKEHQSTQEEKYNKNN